MYPGIDIDRTVDVTPYGSAVQGGQLRYSVKITNRSNDPVYAGFRAEQKGKPYYGEDYFGLTVREKLPVGTRLYYANANAEVEGDTLHWTVDIPAGSTRELYRLRENTPSDGGQLRRMVVHGYCGGIAVYTDNNADEPRINEFREDYLEPGDVLVFMRLTPYDPEGAPRRVAGTRVMVYLGKERFIAAESGSGQIKYIRRKEILWESFLYDVFLNLRPTQAFEDINQL